MGTLVTILVIAGCSLFLVLSGVLITFYAANKIAKEVAKDIWK